jgi:hypothetical protein
VLLNQIDQDDGHHDDQHYDCQEYSVVVGHCKVEWYTVYDKNG